MTRRRPSGARSGRVSRAEPQRRGWPRAAIVLAVTGAMAGAILLARRAAGPLSPPAGRVPSQASDATPAGVDPKAPAGDLPPLPSFAHAARPPEIVQAAYEFAARHPEVLSYVPCFCGCERRGHRSNHDCFVSARDAEGPVTWSSHAVG